MTRFAMALSLTFCLFFAQHLLIADEPEFDPAALKSEYFNSEKIKDGEQFSDKQGYEYKIKNSDSSKGIYIRYEKRWKKHGAWFQFYKGRLTEKTTYYYGKRDGVKESYHENGEVKMFYQYKENKKEGAFFYHNKKGLKIETGQYSNNKKEGTWDWFTTKERLQFRKNYRNGKLHGEHLQYNDKGKVVARKQYADGKQQGKTIWTH